MSGFIYGLPETFCTFTNNRLLGSYWLFNNRNVFTPFGESVPISRHDDRNPKTGAGRGSLDAGAFIVTYVVKLLSSRLLDRVVVNLVWP